MRDLGKDIYRTLANQGDSESFEVRPMRRKPVEKPVGHKSDDVVTSVSQDEFTKFISAPYVIIKAGDGATPEDYPYPLKLRLGIFHVPRVRLGVVDLSTIDWTPLVKFYVSLRLAQVQMNADSQGRPPPGYYLFANGALLGFHPGQIDFDEDGGSLGAAFLTGVVALWAQSTEVAQVVPRIATWNAGERVAKMFEQVIREHIASFFSEPEVELPSAKSDADKALHQAYEILGISPDASDEVVTSAYRRLIKENHPDRAGKSALEQSQATRRTAELNAARDFIVKQRNRK